jgi:branched-chain amino acid aminotransferase/4-amino-4-deoxychorismate lyase
VNRVPSDDRGLTLGDGLFETLLARNGELIAFDLHLARMARGCAVLGLPAPDAQAAEAVCLQALEFANALSIRAAVRLTLTAGSGGRGLDRPAAPAPRLFATIGPAPPRAPPARLITAQVRRNDASPVSRLKTLSYLDSVLARNEAVSAGADEAVMLNTRGQVACAAAANLIWLRDGRLETPALDCGALDGVVRGEILRRAPAAGETVHEVQVAALTLTEISAMVLTNSLIGVRAVASLDGRGLDSAALAARLGDWVADLT